VNITGIGNIIFEPLFLAVGELQNSAAVTHIKWGPSEFCCRNPYQMGTS